MYVHEFRPRLGAGAGAGAGAAPLYSLRASHALSAAASPSSQNEMVDVIVYGK